MPETVESLAQYDAHANDLRARDAEITGLIEDACVFIKEGKISWFGPWRRRPKATKRNLPIMETGVATPGWIDCHTHSVFAGHRADEFMLRNAGRPYVEILEAGGGILQTVEATRQATQEELAYNLAVRAFEFIRRGITTIEVKTGYGLSTEDELKCLRAIKDAQTQVPCELIPCFLGAHAIPLEYRERRQDYIDLVCDEMIPAVAKQKLARYCDVFCDRGAFDADEARQILTTAQKHHMIARIHADEITHAKAAQLAAEIGCASADHLEHSTAEDLQAMADTDVVGVLMPAVNLFLGTTDHLADARGLLNAGGEVALSTDFNPGSAMTQDIGLILNLACTLYKMTPGEALRAITIGAAKALRRDDLGRMRVGQSANLTLLDVPNLSYIPYFVGQNHVEGVIWKGQFVYWIEDEGVE